MYDEKLEQCLLCSLDRSINETNKTYHDILLPTYDTLLCEVRIFEAHKLSWTRGGKSFSLGVIIPRIQMRHSKRSI
jgi:hypothetical protein